MANENDGKPWSDEHLHQLKILITQNTPTGVIALKLGRTEDAIRSKVESEAYRLRRRTAARGTNLGRFGHVVLCTELEP